LLINQSKLSLAVVFYVLSLVDHISGYGNFAAVTTAGRLFCLLFGIIGIPFMLSGQVK
jgi:hypothetical protein